MTAAESEWKQAIAIKPEYTPAHQSLAMFYQADAQWHDALREWKLLHHQFPQDAVILEQLGHAAEQANLSEQSRKAYAQAIQHAPESLHLKTKLASAMAQEGLQYRQDDSLYGQAQASTALRTAVTLNPLNYQAQLALAKATPNPAEASGFQGKALTEAVLSQPGHSPAHLIEQASAMLNYQEFDSARQALDTAVKGAQSPQALVYLAEQMMVRGHLSFALKAFERAMILSKPSPGSQIPAQDPVESPAWKASKLGIQKVIQLQQDQAILLVQARSLSSKSPQRVLLLTQAKAIDRWNKEPYLLLARYYEKIHRLPECQASYRALLALDPYAANARQLKRKLF
jgi:Tfp pilus assembly protein PilF